MKDDDALPVSTPTSSSSPGMLKKENYSVVTSLFGRIRYKFWALAAILLLAFWSMLTGTASLRWSTGNLSRFDLDYESPAAEDLDVLDLEEREKLVKHMWDVYTNNPRIGLGGFWREAFVAAYEVLTSEESEDRETAISEIARMSIRHLPFLHSSSSMGWEYVLGHANRERSLSIAPTRIQIRETLPRSAQTLTEWGFLTPIVKPRGIGLVVLAWNSAENEGKCHQFLDGN
ncbi:hypothetical protein ACS0TY_029496 [Phlomoides rotata]